MKRFYISEQLVEDAGHGWQGKAEADNIFEADTEDVARKYFQDLVEIEPEAEKHDSEAIAFELCFQEDEDSDPAIIKTHYAKV